MARAASAPNPERYREEQVHTWEWSFQDKVGSKFAGSGKEIATHEAVKPSKAICPSGAKDHAKPTEEQVGAVYVLAAAQRSEGNAQKQANGHDFEREPAEIYRVSVVVLQIPQQQRCADYEIDRTAKEESGDRNEENPEGQHSNQKRGKNQSGKERYRVNDIAGRIWRGAWRHQHSSKSGGFGVR
jgi:hypothetical protein